MPQYTGNAQVGTTYAHIGAAATTVVKAKAGFLSGLTINSASDGTITIYDNTAGSGQVVAIITVSAPITVPTPVSYNVECLTGLTIVTTAACDLTVAFR